ncbi:MAG: type II toxin-antitoxin system VapC family toxin [Acidimicrobiia bacterium]|nr:type II toxin-antitoxin system VapC family toxin [Acidimicrobiia bacterium]MYC46161.1 type II toxin-antitoxin system VapC family toxin [Acidimicrobiia bacterium]MYI19318.1 type II toxin-antitoxin system VapC family toxin [Acidimicrobiia bacterium]
MSEEVRSRGLLDTSVLIELYSVGPGRFGGPLPDVAAVSTITLAELASGPLSAPTSAEHARRLDVLLRARAGFDALPFDTDAARAYARIYAATLEVGRKPRGARATDLLIAAVALANDLAVYTCNEADFAHLRDLVDVVAVT